MSIISLVSIENTQITFYGAGMAQLTIKASMGDFSREITRFYALENPTNIEKDALYAKRDNKAKDLNRVIEEFEAYAVDYTQKLYVEHQSKIKEVKRAAAAKRPPKVPAVLPYRRNQASGQGRS